MQNLVILIGYVGREPEVRESSSGEFVKFPLATTEKWKNKQGERQEKTEWHNVVCYSEGLTNVIKNYVKKGDKIYIQGKLRTRKYESNGDTKYATEVVLDYDGKMHMLDNKQLQKQQSRRRDDEDDGIPF